MFPNLQTDRQTNSVFPYLQTDEFCVSVSTDGLTDELIWGGLGNLRFLQVKWALMGRLQAILVLG